jgi:RNA polymerase sigma factor (sigma-70 family)
MTTTHADVLLRHLRTFAAGHGADATDRQLLERFARRREQAAFEALVRRHAQLVLGVCRRVLNNDHDAEDAFQATFLVLARKAPEVGRQGSVAGWLHRVAYHAAVKALARATSRQEHERQAPPRRPPDLLEEVTGRELLAVLDEELQRLPEERRGPLVLCYLQGHTCDEAARQLGLTARTLKRRLEQGRASLRARLARRGIALPAALLTLGLTRGAKASVPASLGAAAVTAALSGATPGGAAGALADAVLRGLGATRMKWAAALLLLGALLFGTGVLARQAQAQRAGPAEPPSPRVAPAPPAPRPPKDGEEAKASAVTGRVLDADGKPVAGARVAGYAEMRFGALSVQYQAKSLGETKTDAEGRFQLSLPRKPDEPVDVVWLLTGAKGYGPAWRHVNPSGGTAVELRLPPEEAVIGRLIDLQGQPLGKAKVRPRRVLPAGPAEDGPAKEGGDLAASRRRHLLALERRSKSFEFHRDSPIKDTSPWPAAVTTDAEGRFRVSGFGKGQEVDLVIEDDRVATQEITVRAGDKERSFSLLPPQRVSGRVVTADTGKPVVGASVWVTMSHDRLGYGLDTRTDADGRYSVNAYPGETYVVTAYPTAGIPYLAAYRQGDWPKGAVKQEVDVALPRGVVVRGKVVEAGTGKTLLSATVAFVPRSAATAEGLRKALTGRDHKYFTGADGGFEIVVPPGPGHLVVTAPTDEYVYQTVSDGELQTGKPGGAPHQFHAVLPLDLTLKGEPKEVKVELRRSVSIRGRIVDPDGKAVKDAIVIVPSELLPAGPYPGLPGLALTFGIPLGTRITAFATRDGAFELHNCDPDRTYRVFVYSGRAEGGMFLAGRPSQVDAVSVVNRLIAAKDVLGAAADLSAKAAGGKAVEVKLAPCESAEVRFVDGKKQAVKQKVWLELLVKPGEAALLASPYSLGGEKSPLEPDAAGRITLPGLIPGVTYRLKVLTGQEGIENETAFEKEFTVEAGKKTKLELKAPESK